jgi:hypothetical protein
VFHANVSGWWVVCLVAERSAAGLSDTHHAQEEDANHDAQEDDEDDAEQCRADGNFARAAR